VSRGPEGFRPGRRNPLLNLLVHVESGQPVVLAGENEHRDRYQVPSLILDQAQHPIIRDLRGSAQRDQFDQEHAADDRAAGLLGQLAAGADRAAGGQDIVDHENAGVGRNGVDVDLQRVGRERKTGRSGKRGAENGSERFTR
jgi:hypothetical protein